MDYELDSKQYDQYIELESKIVKLENEISDLKTNKEALIELSNRRYDIIDDFASEIASLKFWNKEYKKNYAELEKKLNLAFSNSEFLPNTKLETIRGVITQFFHMYKPR
tara:strand:- start:236 stop:562 length:327 start_codon:yes stop_codon:yes gene_type:complete